jgi:hypothetical protein
LRRRQAIYDRPDTTAARKVILKPGTPVFVLAAHENFELVRYGDLTGWVSKR